MQGATFLAACSRDALIGGYRSLQRCELLISQRPEAAKRVIEEEVDASCFPGFCDRQITERRRDGS
jgi:hypothetical protein